MKLRRSLRARLFVAFVVVAVGVLTVWSLAIYVVLRRSIADEALDDMRARSDQLVALAEDFTVDLPEDDPATPRINEFRDAVDRLRRLGTALELTDLVAVVIGPDGQVVQPPFVERSGEPLLLPPELDISDIDTDAVLAGEESSGRREDLVFLARPLTETRVGVVTVVATDSIDVSVLRRVRPLVAVTAGLVLVVAAFAAAWLARRLLRPIGSIETTARQLATGDLSARASVSSRTDNEVRALAETMNSLAARLEETRDADRAFLLSVSHDLRTPLTSIRGYAEALADGTLDAADPEARERATAVIRAETRRLERLVRDLLDLARLDTHQFTLTPRRCDASAVVRDSAAAFVPAARDLGLALDLDAAEPVPADLDADRLGQIVANLVENALKFASSRIVVETRGSGDHVEVVVTDDGPGIAAAELEKVFDRLYTARASAGRPVGTGIGLAIVRELSAAMGGTVHAETPSNGGIRLVVGLPVGPAVTPS